MDKNRSINQRTLFADPEDPMAKERFEHDEKRRGAKKWGFMNMFPNHIERVSKTIKIKKDIVLCQMSVFSRGRDRSELTEILMKNAQYENVREEGEWWVWDAKNKGHTCWLTGEDIVNLLICWDNLDVKGSGSMPTMDFQNAVHKEDKFPAVKDSVSGTPLWLPPPGWQGDVVLVNSIAAFRSKGDFTFDGGIFVWTSSLYDLDDSDVLDFINLDEYAAEALERARTHPE